MLTVIPHSKPRLLGTRAPLGVFRTAVALLVACLLAGCSTTRLPPISAVGETFTPLPDEQLLWEEAREEERQLLEEGVRIYDDPELVAYLDDVVAGLTPRGVAANPLVEYRITVLEEPSLNAFAFPHGALYIHTGLLARLENEAQLATILGHEMSHVEYRHMVRYKRSVENKEVAFFAAAVLAEILLAEEIWDTWWDDGPYDALRVSLLGGLLVHLGLEVAFFASVKGYGRNLEREADTGAFRKLQKRGYDLREAVRVYNVLLEDRGDPHGLEVFFFSSHPQLSQRVANAEEWLLAQGPSEGAHLGDEERFAERLYPVLQDNASFDLEAGRLELAHEGLKRALERRPQDAEVHYLLGVLHAEQARVADDAEQSILRMEARRAFRETLRLDPQLAEAHRELGWLAWGEEDWAAACVALSRYFEILPEADDTETLEALEELRDGGFCPPGYQPGQSPETNGAGAAPEDL